MITKEEYLSINAYTSTLYKKVDPALRGADAAEWQALADYGTSGLLKLLNSGYGYSGLSFRAFNLTDDQVTRLFPEGGTFTDASFFSTFIEKCFPGNVQITVDGHSGVNIGKMMERPGDSEVLFAPNTTFKVANRIFDPKSGAWCINLKEL